LCITRTRLKTGLLLTALQLIALGRLKFEALVTQNFGIDRL
jgi:hypothetical protein